MSCFKARSKQALTILLAFLLLFAMVPNTLAGGAVYAEEWGNTSAEERGVTLSTDKAEYEVGEEIRYHITGIENADGKWDPWLGLYDYGASDGYTTSKKYIYVGNVEDGDFLEAFGLTSLDPGKYHLILSTGDSGNDVPEIWATLDFTVNPPKWGNTSTEERGVTLSTDKAEYEVGEEIRYHITGIENADGKWDPWLGLYDYGASDGYTTSKKYIYVGNVEDGDFLEAFGLTSLDPGKYHLILSTGDSGNDVPEIWATLDFTVTSPIVSSLSTDKTKYQIGEPILVTATSPSSGAWVGLYEYDNSDPLDTTLLSYFYVSDANGEAIDILSDDAVYDKLEDNPVGRYKVILFTSDYNIDEVDGHLAICSFWIGEYENPTWTWNEDHEGATATFTEKDNPSVTAAASTTEITAVEHEATCTAAAYTTYTATLTADKIRFLTVDEAPFVSPEEVVETGKPLGHLWGEWETITPATEQAEGLERHTCSRCNATEDRVIPKLDHVHVLTEHPAVAATCTTAGNTLYYDCSGCGKYFSDAEAEHEITENSWVIPAPGHDWGDWVFDPETRTHTHTCANDPTHTETFDCTFEKHDSPDPDTDLYVCTVCGGQYEQANVPVITTDKTEYEEGEDIYVVTELNGYHGHANPTDGWVALYEAGQVEYNTSLLWYYPEEFDNPKLLQSVFTPSDTNKENMGDWPEAWGNVLPEGEYELVFLMGSKKPYTLYGKPAHFTVKKGIESETVIKEPTCTEDGLKHVVYKDGTEADIVIPALGHDPKEEWVHDPETRTHYHECTRCDAHVDETPCTFDEGTVTKEATVTEEGEMLYTCTVCGGTYTEVIPNLMNQGVKRVYGSSRYETAILQANELKATLGIEKFETIIVATGNNFADALSGAYLGYVKQAPILLVFPRQDIVDMVQSYIEDNLAADGTVYILGGEAVVPKDIEDGISATFTTKRLFGANRYETNIEILKEVGVGNLPILVCDGNNYADSLSASAAKLPILVVNKGLNDDQKEYLKSLPGNDFTIIGGEVALPASLMDELNEFGKVARLGGADRCATSVMVAETFFENPEKAVVAYAINYPDGLCGGTLAAYMDAPLLLTYDGKKDVTAAYTADAGIKSGIVLGGSGLVSDESVRAIFSMAEEDTIYEVTE